VFIPEPGLAPSTRTDRTGAPQAVLALEEVTDSAFLDFVPPPKPAGQPAARRAPPPLPPGGRSVLAEGAATRPMSDREVARVLAGQGDAPPDAVAAGLLGHVAVPEVARATPTPVRPMRQATRTGSRVRAPHLAGGPPPLPGARQPAAALDPAIPVIKGRRTSDLSRPTVQMDGPPARPANTLSRPTVRMDPGVYPPPALLDRSASNLSRPTVPMPMAAPVAPPVMLGTTTPMPSRPELSAVYPAAEPLPRGRRWAFLLLLTAVLMISAAVASVVLR